MAQDAIKLCRIKMSVAAILYELAGFIANPEKMRIEAEIDPAFREINGRDRVAFKVGLRIARRCEKNFHGDVRRRLTPCR